MTGIRQAAVFALGLAIASTGLAAASQQRPYRVSDQQLRDLVDRIHTHNKVFHASFARAIDRNQVTGSPDKSQVERFVSDFDQAIDQLRDRVNDGQSDVAHAENVLRRASLIDTVMTRTQFDTGAENDWRQLKLDLNELARNYGIAWNWNSASQSMPARIDDKRVTQLLKQIERKSDKLDRSLDKAFDRASSQDRQGKDELRRSVRDLKQSSQQLRERVGGRQSNTLDIEEVLRRGGNVDSLMQRYQLSAQAEQNWLGVRGDLDGLARAYNVAWNWSNPGYPLAQGGQYDRHYITGTFQLEGNGGDEARRAAQRAARAVPAEQRSRVYESLLARLEAPERIAIERHNNSVTMASTRGQRVSFEADGRNHMEQWSDGRTMTTRATLENERLVVSTTGNRGSDFTVTFDPMENGRTLHMTRTIDDEGLRQPVTVRSTYRRLSDDARWNIGPTGPEYPYTDSPSGDAGVPDGTRFVALLDRAMNTADAREGDLYTLTTRSPSRYEGAVIQGFVSSVNESGRLTGRSGMTLNLRSIRLRNGTSYRFDGVIEGVRTPDGEAVRLDREGTIDSDDSQTRKTVERSAIGAAFGAIVGAITGGGSGAAIGAAIGAGGGAGTVLIEGRDRLEHRHRRPGRQPWYRHHRLPSRGGGVRSDSRG